MEFAEERLKTFERTHQIFKEEMYAENDPILCHLHNSFGADEGAHNCLGCNFADLTASFEGILRVLPLFDDIQGPCSTYILWLYLFVERYDQVMNYVSVPTGYKARHFPALQRIRRWANFIKHPKAFLFCHHPNFFHGEEVGDDLMSDNTIVINGDFIDQFYSGGKENNKLAHRLNNATDVFVVFPNPENLMSAFVDETKKFINMMENNEVYREELAKITTKDDYFESVHMDDSSQI